ncbi:mitochondrial solute carrier family 25 (mitochondrial oxoglutarate transporter) member 11 [Andalucia godoyi]|uniref:Mitochondrial solute carrier family 25 (Mitochondrial oxoglutarate transporter) member 11 n=1 Tax=Andalucia godoyi TaxID=505711 RepID=A0A8K0F342_ANDGO|nr:mitochondrial solute carrier family 25 (mitochondrial oxoglutarate transporter) member 11 [Andalucia godoyi]|eukprot:ANDGO_03100.mRNA.1 mitochondrial solute carrier family 25 (mitochondrial oxoglutarate transporter) member 11
MAPFEQTLFGQYMLGSAAGLVAVSCTHPMDLVKVRMQLAKKAAAATASSATTTARPLGVLGTAAQVVRTKGVFGLYNGLTAAYTRQVLYTGTRIAVYDALKGLLSSGDKQSSPSMAKKAIAAAVCGSVGAAVACPADVVMVRMQSNAYPYKNIADGLVQLTRTEGVARLWSGATPTMLRASLVAIGQLAVYDQTRDALIHAGYLKAGPAAYFVASMVAGFAATAFSNPVDVVKTRVMNGSSPDPVACVRDMMRNEGPMAFWKGFVPNWARQGPQTMITMVAYNILLDFVKGRSSAK